MFRLPTFQFDSFLFNLDNTAYNGGVHCCFENHYFFCHIKAYRTITPWIKHRAKVFVSSDVFKQQYTYCMKVGSGVDLGLSREKFKKLFGPIVLYVY